jgi:hypothetical protein
MGENSLQVIHLMGGNINKHNKCKLLNNRTINIWVNDINRYFSNEEVQMANKHMKKCTACTFFSFIT